MKPGRPSESSTQPRPADTSRLRTRLGILRMARGLMMLGCLGTLLLFGLCITDTISLEVGGWMFFAVFIGGLIGTVVHGLVPGETAGIARTRRLTKQYGSRLLRIVERRGGSAYVSEIILETGWTSADVNMILAQLSEEGAVVVDVDEEGRSKVVMVGGRAGAVGDG